MYSNIMVHSDFQKHSCSLQQKCPDKVWKPKPSFNLWEHIALDYPLQLGCYGDVLGRNLQQRKPKENSHFFGYFSVALVLNC